jgi:hypothetical protein
MATARMVGNVTLLGLRLRAWLGWGLHPEELRFRSAMFLRMFRAVCVMLPVWSVLLLVTFALSGRHSQWPPSANSMRGMAVFVICILGIWAALLLTPAVASWWLARRGANESPTSRYGQCYAIRLDPPGLFFARIGETPRTARWYRLPLDWDRIVGPSGAQFELSVLAATGWVERVRRLGTPFREVSQPVPIPLSLTAPAETEVEFAGDADDGSDADLLPSEEDVGATDEERRALR